jgi:hypothetical protein
MFNVLTANQPQPQAKQNNRIIGANVGTSRRNGNNNAQNRSFENMVRALNEQQVARKANANANATVAAPQTNMIPQVPAAAIAAPRTNMIPQVAQVPAPLVAAPQTNMIPGQPMNITSSLNIKVPQNLEKVNQPVALTNNQIEKMKRNENMARRKVAVTQFLYKIFNFLNQIKLYHWQTRIYSRHKASDELFSELIEKIDEFVETYMGKYKRMYINDVPNMELSLELENMNDDDMATYLREEVLEYFMVDLYDLIGDDDTDLENIKDEIVGQIKRTLYLFTLRNGNKSR